MNKIKVAILVSCFFALSSGAVQACDLCAIYNSIESQQPEANSLVLSVAEQFTAFDDVQDSGRHVENIGHQHMESSITQIVGAFDFTKEFGLQFNLPYINRRYSRFESDVMSRGTEAGIGDLSVLGRITPYHFKDSDSTFTLQMFAGLKIPTGDSERLKEELEEHHEPDLEEEDEHEHEEEIHENFARHGGSHDEFPSAVHGHDLALGSGSFDYPIGGSIFAQYDKVLLLGSIQYVFRTEGDSNYRYANDLTYNVGPAVFLLTDHDYTMTLGANLSGEYKRKDTGPNGDKQGDTGIRSMFIGPQLALSLGKNLSTEIAYDYPLDINNTEFQIVPSYKLRAGITYRFG